MRHWYDALNERNHQFKRDIFNIYWFASFMCCWRYATHHHSDAWQVIFGAFRTTDICVDALTFQISLWIVAKHGLAMLDRSQLESLARAVDSQRTHMWLVITGSNQMEDRHPINIIHLCVEANQPFALHATHFWTFWTWYELVWKAMEGGF